MTDRELLIELLAIKMYEHDNSQGNWPPSPGWSQTTWRRLHRDDRQIYRDMIARASNPEGMYVGINQD